MAATSASINLPADRRSPYLARRFVAEQLDAWGFSDAEEVAVLLVSELVTNGVTHTETAVGVAVGCDGDTVAVAVADGEPTGIDPERACSRRPRGAPSGRGLQIVDVLADQWGVAVHDAGKTVWFEVTFPTGR